MLSAEFPVISQKIFQEEGILLSQEISKGAKIGYCFLEMPEECKLVINEVKNFGKWCFDSKLNNPNNYNSGDNIQREQVFFRQNEWIQLLPKEVQTFFEKTSSINQKILKIVYRLFCFAESEFEKISGGVTSQKGLNYLNFSHYRFKMPVKGIGEHKDTGQMTLLWTDKVGLEILVQESWVPINLSFGFISLEFREFFSMSFTIFFEKAGFYPS